jgi:hypothetical protein
MAQSERSRVQKMLPMLCSAEHIGRVDGSALGSRRIYRIQLHREPIVKCEVFLVS